MPPLVLCSLAIIVTLVTSGIAKAKDPTSTALAIANLKIDRWVPMKAASRYVPWGELALALCILLLPGWGALLGSIAAALLFTFYWLVIARAVFTGNTASCNCFGARSKAPISGFTLGRNTALLVAALGALFAAISTGHSVLGILVSLDVTGWLWLFGAACVAVALWCLYRAELVPTTADSGEAAVEVLANKSLAGSLSQVDNEDTEYVRLPIPFGTLHSLQSDSTLSLRELAQQQARVLFWVSPGCYPCRKIIEQIEHWQAKLPMLRINPVISAEEHRTRLNLSKNIEVLVDQNFATEPVFGRGTPLAVALGADGLLAGGPVLGEKDIVQFMHDLMVEFGVDS